MSRWPSTTANFASFWLLSCLLLIWLDADSADGDRQWRFGSVAARWRKGRFPSEVWRQPEDPHSDSIDRRGALGQESALFLEESSLFLEESSLLLETEFPVLRTGAAVSCPSQSASALRRGAAAPVRRRVCYPYATGVKIVGEGRLLCYICSRFGKAHNGNYSPYALTRRPRAPGPRLILGPNPLPTCSNPLKRLKMAMGKPCNELA